jgi:nitrite reductase/ring-hydroxylating ferredoxin subunit
MAVIRRADRLRAAIAALPFEDPDALPTHPSASSDTVFEIDRRFVLPRGWTLVAPAAAVAAAGDAVATSIGAEAVVAVRGRDGELRALSNVCTHRASLVVTESGNCGRTMVCPYHGWIFGLDGKLLGVPYRTGFDEVPQESLGLARFALEEWGGLVMVDPSGCAASSGTPLAGGPFATGPGLEWRLDSVDDLESDWKSAVLDGFDEGIDAIVAVAFPASVVAISSGRLVALRWEPLTPGTTRRHRLVATAPPDETLQLSVSAQVRGDWCRAYADMLKALVAS